MHAGSDSADAQTYTQWALNPSYQKMSSEEVDWAALAQQWIIMKEAGPPVPEQATNPPQSSASKPQKRDVGVSEGGGEAPMDVENDPDDGPLLWNEGTGSGDSWHWNQQQQPPPWNNWSSSWSAPPPNVPPPTTTAKQPLLPTPANYTQFGNNDNCNDNANTNYGYNAGQPNEFPGGYWSSAGTSKVIKPHNKRYSKVNVPTTVPASKPINLDAAKRKQLPAWIREGLEKMERDKLKHLDKVRENQEKEEFQAKMKLSEKNAMQLLKDAVKEQQKSKFESEGEDTEEDNDGRPLTPEDPPLSQEDLMIKVRRTMTEILLKVTNREIFNICKEEVQRHLKKMKASDQRVSAPSGANLSAKLGLGIYDGSDSSSNSSDDSSKGQHSSDTELRDTIKRRRSEFVRIEREIEDKLAEAERQDGGGGGAAAADGSRAASPSHSDIDSQVDAKVLDPKKGHQRERATPPLKTHRRRNSRHKSASSSSSSSESGAENSPRRSSSSPASSDSEDKYKYKREREESRSKTPETHRRSGGKYSSSYAEAGAEYKRRKSDARRSRSRSSGRRRRSSRSSSTARKRNDRSSSSRGRYRRSRSRSRSPRHYSTSSSRRSNRRSPSYSGGRRKRRSTPPRRSRSRSLRPGRSGTGGRQRRSRSYSSGRGKRSHRH